MKKSYVSSLVASLFFLSLATLASASDLRMYRTFEFADDGIIFQIYTEPMEQMPCGFDGHDNYVYDLEVENESGQKINLLTLITLVDETHFSARGEWREILVKKIVVTKK